MKHRYIVGICLLSCFLVSSISFIDCVQSNEVKKELKEKRDSIVNSIYTKLPSLKTKTEPNCIIAFFTIILAIILITWLILFIIVAFFNIIWAGLMNPGISFEELIGLLILSIAETGFLILVGIVNFGQAFLEFLRPYSDLIDKIVEIIWTIIDFIGIFYELFSPLIDIILLFVYNVLSFIGEFLQPLIEPFLPLINQIRQFIWEFIFLIIKLIDLIISIP